MKKYILYSFLFLLLAKSNYCYSLSDSLYPLTDQELLKLSNLIYELEKKDSLASATELNGFALKSILTISDSLLLIDLIDDSIHYYTGNELIILSNYIFELERRDSIRKVNDSLQKVEKLKNFEELKLLAEKLKNFEELIYFNIDDTEIRGEYKLTLDTLILGLKSFENFSITIEGYADIIGRTSYIKSLSVKRAEMVKNYLISNGLDEQRITSIKGYGGSRYLYSNSTEEGRAKNRVVIIKTVH